MACVRRSIPWVVLAVLATATGGCKPASPEVHPVWPPPPAPARIRHLTNLRQASDLVKPGPLDMLNRALTGGDTLTLLRPSSVAVQAGRYVAVTDQERQGVIVFDLKRPRSRFLDRAGEAFFVSPVGVAACGAQVAVSDSALNTVSLLNLDGKLVRRFEKPGGFGRPTGLACDARAGLLYVVDTLANEVCVFETATGRLTRRFGRGGLGGAEFNYPTHVFVDGAGRVYVTDTLNSRVQVLDADGKYLFHIGKLGDASGHLAVPKGVAVDRAGHIYVVDSYFSAVQIFDQKGRLLLSFGDPGRKTGEFQVPTGLTVDEQDRIYVCDSQNKRVQIFQYLGGDDHEPAPLEATSTSAPADSRTASPEKGAGNREFRE